MRTWAMSCVLALMSLPVFAQPNDPERSLQQGNTFIKVFMENKSDATVSVFWVDADGREQAFGTLEPNAVSEISTYPGHLWRVKQNGKVIRRYRANAQARQTVTLTTQPMGNNPAKVNDPDKSLTLGQGQVTVVVTNNTGGEVLLRWVDFEGVEKDYGKLASNAVSELFTGPGHLWKFRQNGKVVGRYRASTQARQTYKIAVTKQPDPMPVGNNPPNNTDPEKSINLGGLSTVTFNNKTNAEVAIIFVDLEGVEKFAGNIPAGGNAGSAVSQGSLWKFKQNNKFIGRYRITKQQVQTYDVTLNNTPTPLNNPPITTNIPRGTISPADVNKPNPLANIVPYANPDGSLDVAWLGSDNRIRISTYSGQQFQNASHQIVNNTLNLLGGFTKDEQLNSYIFTAQREALDNSAWVNGLRDYRANLVKIVKVPQGAQNSQLVADLNQEKFAKQWKIYNPLVVEGGNSYVSSHLAYGKGKLGVNFAHNIMGTGGRHQTSIMIGLGADGSQFYNGGGAQHCAGLKLIHDGQDFVMGQVFEGGVGLSKLTQDGKWSDHILVFKNTWKGKVYGDGFVRIGGIATTPNGYIVQLIWGKGFIWNYGPSEWYDVKEGTAVYTVHVPKNFHSLKKFDWVQPTWDVPDTPANFTPRSHAQVSAGNVQVRPMMIKFPNNTYALLWEEWKGDQFGRPTYQRTKAMLVNGNGQPIINPKTINGRIQHSADGVYLPKQNRVAWVTGDAENNRLTLYSLDASLNLATHQLRLP